MASPFFKQRSKLLNLCFFVDHMLANDRIKLLDLHLVGHGSLVFGRCVEMTCAGRGHQLNLISHGNRSCLKFFAAGPKVSNNIINATLVDNSHAFRRHS
jgi:hypothetical protein